MKMNENKKKYKSIHKPDFKIHKFVKIYGIRTKKNNTDLSRFISPIFGNKVLDKVVIPETPEEFNGNKKRFNTFRNDFKNNDKSYSEFRIISNDSREKYLGGKPFVSSFEQKENSTNQKDVIAPIIASKKDSINQYKNDEFNFNQDDEIILKGNFESFSANENQEEKKHDEDTYEKSLNYSVPSINMFNKFMRSNELNPDWLLEHIRIINETLKDFSIDGLVVGSIKGPSVTRYEISLNAGVNVNKINNISDNLMMNLKVKSLRIEAPIPGKAYVGIEVANVNPEIVAFGNLIDNQKFLDSKDKPLLVGLGVDIDGNNVYVDIAKMPHGLIAGATNSGKSVCINTILASLLIKNSPNDLKLILIDPKMVELNAYNDLPHLITPVITDSKMASAALKWAVEEMEKRYHIFAKNRSRDIASYNINVEKKIISMNKMPYIVIVIDELSDLMMASGSEVEDSIQRLTQKARAAGIHLIIATQRPTTDVIKGTIKSNIPTRIAFKVTSHIDSSTILDGTGAEELLGKGDMLLKENDSPKRLQGAYIKDEEIYQLTDYIRSLQEPNYILKHEDLIKKVELIKFDFDDLLNEVAYFVVESKNASINKIMQEFAISFNRAQNIVKQLESLMIVSQNLGTKPREVLVNNNDELKEILENNERKN